MKEDISDKLCRHDNSPLFVRQAKPRAEKRAIENDSYYYARHFKCYACKRIYYYPEDITYPMKKIGTKIFDTLIPKPKKQLHTLKLTATKTTMKRWQRVIKKSGMTPEEFMDNMVYHYDNELQYRGDAYRPSLDW
jgi:hypothetical protein